MGSESQTKQKRNEAIEPRVVLIKRDEFIVRVHAVLLLLRLRVVCVASHGPPMPLLRPPRLVPKLEAAPGWGEEPCGMNRRRQPPSAGCHDGCDA